MLLISFYTNDWEYPAHAERMRRRCEQLGVECRIEERPNAGGWLQNTLVKPHFIREVLQREKRSVLWVDVDNNLHRKPVVEWDASKGVAASKRKDGTLIRGEVRTWHVGALWFDYTPRSLAFLDTWCLSEGVSDDHTFETAWRAHPGAVARMSPLFFRLRSAPWATISHGSSKDSSKHEQMRRLRQRHA